jgi:hypothetical protein
MKPKYCENIIVAVIYRKKFNWYITNKELWRMDFVKEYKSWKECYISMGRTEKQFMYDIGSLEEFCSKRWGIKVLDVKNADVFLSKIEKNKISSSELKQMFEDASDEEKNGYYPTLYVNFDKKEFYSFFPEPENFESFIPDGWKSNYMKFDNLISKDFRYWK